MNSELLSGIIGALATLIVGIISSPWISNYFIERNKSKIYIKRPNRLSCLSGNWSGTTIQKKGIDGKDMLVEIDVTFLNKNNLITGKTIVKWKEKIEKKSLVIDFEGGFISENFVRLFYQHKNSEIQNYGIIFLKLNASGNILEGDMIGFGNRYENIITGKTIITKNL
jgi:hypothetical protein